MCPRFALLPLTLHILNRRAVVVNSFFAFFCKFYTFSCLCYLLYNLYVFLRFTRVSVSELNADALKRVLRAVAVAPRVFAWLVRLRRFLGHFTALYGHCIAVARLRRLYTRADGGAGMWERAQRGGVLPRTIPITSLGQTAVIRRVGAVRRGGKPIRVTSWIIY